MFALISAPRKIPRAATSNWDRSRGEQSLPVASSIAACKQMAYWLEKEAE
jgi:hypothetical protein